MRMRSITLAATVVALMLPMSLLMERLGEAGQDSPQLERAVGDSLKGRDFNDIEVAVTGSEALLSGKVPHFWAKDRAIKRALGVDGIETVASELELPEAESDQDIAEAVVKEIRRYPHYTMWDDITARVQGGRGLHWRVGHTRSRQGLRAVRTGGENQGCTKCREQHRELVARVKRQAYSLFHCAPAPLEHTFRAHRQHEEPAASHHREQRPRAVGRLCPGPNRDDRDSAYRRTNPRRPAG